MAGYIRQSTFVDGDTITASLFNNEYNQLVNSFSNTSGHKHDGTTAEGPVIGLIGDAGETSPNNKVLIDTTNNFIEFYVQVSDSPVQQMYIADGAIVPTTDSDVDLGTTGLRFKDAYIDTVTTTGNVAVGGNLTVTGTTTFNGGTITMGDAATDNVVFGADVDSNIIPDDDDSYDLGSSTQEWRDLYIDGTAHIDTLDVDVNATIAGTLGVTGVLTGTSLDISGDIDVDGTTNLDVVDIDGAVDMATTLTVAGNVDFNGDLDVDGTTNLDVVDIDGAVDMATTLAVAGNVDFNGDLDVDGTANLDVVDIDGAVDMATTLTVAGNVDFNGDLDVDGTTNLDVVDIDGAVDMATTLAVGGEITAASLDISGNVDIDGVLETDGLSINGTTVTSTAAELNILDGVTSTATELNLLDGVTSTTAELNILDGVTASAADINLIDGITNGTVIASKAIITDANKDITGGRNITISGELDAATLDISGDADIDGTLEADAITIGGITLAETISDTVGAMVTSNTESGITVAYDDTDNTLDFTVGTLNQDTTGNAATATALATARTIGGTSFDGTANIAVGLADTATALATARTIGGTSFDGTANIAVGLADTATALATARTIHGVSFDGTANIDLTEVVQDTVGAMVSSNTESNITVTYEDSDGTLDFTVATLNQDTTGNAATATALETARTIHGISFDGTANIDLSEVIQDTVGAMVSSNTESGITVTYQDGDGTLDFSVASSDSTQIIDADSDTKIQVEESSDEDKIRFDTGGTERMIIDSTGVGIGTSSPDTLTHLLTSTTSAVTPVLKLQGNFTANDSSEGTSIDFVGSSDATAVGSRIIGTRAAAGGNMDLRFHTARDAFAMIIDESQNVGISTTSPARALEVHSSSSPIIESVASSSNNSSLRLRGSTSSGHYWDVQHVHGDNDLTFGWSGSEKVRITDTGNVGIGTTSPDYLLEVETASSSVAPKLGFRNTQAGTQIGMPSNTNALAFYTGDNERMRIESDGDVTIGDGASNIDIGIGNTGTVEHLGRTGSGALIQLGGDDCQVRLANSILHHDNSGNTNLYLRNHYTTLGNDNNAKVTLESGTIVFATSTAYTERMRINSSGNVGIGTTDAGNAKLVINGSVSGGADTACIDFDGYGTYGTNASQSINFRMGRTGQATDQPASIKAIFPGGGATAAATHLGFEFNAINANTLFTTARFSGVAARIQFNTDEVPQSSNPVTQQAIVIGPSTSGAVTQGLTNATVLQNRSGELYAIDSSHNNTQITPHNWGLISSGPSEELAWTYYSQRPNPSNNDQLQTINVDMAKVIRKVEDLVGEKLIYTENSDKDGHTFQTIISDIQTSLTNLTTRIEALEG